MPRNGVKLLATTSVVNKEKPMSFNVRITESEWQVMRVLWEQEGLTSGEIHNILQERSSWSPTTVKTFLSRLVSKNVIKADKSERFPRYFTLITERDCVLKEMQNIIKVVYGGVLNKSTTHFNFFGHKDVQFIELLSLAIERTYERISTILDYSPSDKQSIYLYSSQKRLHSALGFSPGPSWLRAGWQWEILHLAPKELFEGNEAEEMLGHVYTELSIHKINHDLPYFLRQGVATYLSEWIQDKRIHDSLKKHFNTISLDYFNQINRHGEDFRSMGGYELACTLIEYIEAEYGKTKLLQIVKELKYINQLSTMLGEQFIDSYKSYISQKYLNDKEYSLGGK